MKKLERRTISFTLVQLKALEAASENLDISIAELIRRIIDKWRAR